MKILRMAWVNYKRLIKDKGTIGFMFVMPLIIIIAVHFTMRQDDKILNVNVAFNVQDKGAYAGELLKDIGASKDIFYNDSKKAMELLEKNDVLAVYDIPADFSEKLSRGEKPVIQSYKREKGNATLPVETGLNDNINKRLKEQLLLRSGLISDKKELYRPAVKTVVETQKRNIDEDLFFAAIMVIYFIILSSNNIGGELQNLKKQRVMARAMTTANKGWQITGSIYLAMFFLQISINLLVLLAAKLIMGFSAEGIVLILANMILASLVSISLGLLITRISENPAVTSLTLTLVTVATTLLGVMGLAEDGIREIPWVLQNLAKFAPQYWLLDSIDKMRLFPNALVLLLMAAAMFTAGNIRVRGYGRK